MYDGPARNAGITHVVVVWSDGSRETMSEVVPLEVHGSEVAP